MIDSNNPPANDTISNSSNSTNDATKNDDSFPDHDANNRRKIIDLTVEGCKCKEDEDSITNPDMVTPSSKAL